MIVVHRRTLEEAGAEAGVLTEEPRAIHVRPNLDLLESDHHHDHYVMIRLAGIDAEGKTIGDPVLHTKVTDLRDGMRPIGVTIVRTGAATTATTEVAGTTTLEGTTNVEEEGVIPIIVEGHTQISAMETISETRRVIEVDEGRWRL